MGEATDRLPSNVSVFRDGDTVGRVEVTVRPARGLDDETRREVNELRRTNTQLNVRINALEQERDEAKAALEQQRAARD